MATSKDYAEKGTRQIPYEDTHSLPYWTENTIPGQYQEVNPGQELQLNIEFDPAEETKTYNVHERTGDYIIGEVGRINVNNGQTLEVVKHRFNLMSASIAILLFSGCAVYGCGWDGQPGTDCRNN